MDIIEIIKIAIFSLRINLMRSFLTMLGVIIGVASVILLVSIGSGLQNYISSQFESLGTNLIYIAPGKILGEEGQLSLGQGIPNFAGSKLTAELTRELARIGRPVKDTTGFTETPSDVKFGGKTTFTTVEGAMANAAEMIALTISEGRFINQGDLETSKKIAVLGPKLVEKLYKNNEPLGTEITIGESKFKVVGILESKGGGGLGGANIDDVIYIPLTTAQKLFNLDNLHSIIVQARTKEDIPEAVALIRNKLKKQLREDEFSVLDSKELLKTIESILSVLTLALGGIAAISLLVGGIGIMNIMLVSVTERIKEIGLRKALGATYLNILLQFLIEAVVLSALGGIIGILIGFAGGLLLSNFLPSTITIWSVILSFSVSATVGIIFGVAPAIKAARLDPITALRYE